MRTYMTSGMKHIDYCSPAVKVKQLRQLCLLCGSPAVTGDTSTEGYGSKDIGSGDIIISF